MLDHLFSYGSERLDRIAFQRALDQIGADESAGTDFQASARKVISFAALNCWRIMSFIRRCRNRHSRL